MKIFEIVYIVSVLVDKRKIIVMKVDKDFLRRVIVVLEFGRDVDVNILF